MPATVRYDEQYCPIARALDALGDRWTLLILRELVLGDQRFTDLEHHLPGIAPSLLTQRLRAMTEQGLIETKALPPPAARTVYAATRRGRDAVPVLRALARFGVPLLEAPSDQVVVRPSAAVNSMVAAYYDASRAEGIDERYLFRIDGQEITLSSVRGGGAPGHPPDVVIESSARVWVDLRQGRVSWRDAVDQGLLVVRGRRSCVRNLRRIFHLA